MKSSFCICLAVAASFALAQENSLTPQNAVRIALENRSTIKAAQLHLKEAKSTRQALAAYPATKLAVGVTSKPDVGGSDEDLALFQPIDLFGRVRAGAVQGDAIVLIAEAQLRSITSEVQRDVLVAHAEATAALRLSQTAKATLDIAQKLHDTAERRFEAGDVAEILVLRANLEYERAKQSSLLRQANEEATRRRLAGSMGILIADLPQIDTGNLATLALAQNDLKKSRGDLLRLQGEALLARSEVKNAQLTVAPEVEVQARKSPWYEDDPQYGIRVQLTMPLWDHGRSRTLANAARNKEKALEQSLQDALNLAQAELEAASIEYEAADHQVQSFSKLLAAYVALVEKARVGFEQGAATLVETLEAARALREIEEGLIEAELRRSTAGANLLRASGTLLEERP